MKRLLVICLIEACGAPAPTPPQQYRLPDPVTILMGRLDKDGDGRVALAEFVDPMPGDILSSFDKDGSGDLDREEVDDAMRHAPVNGDGQSPGEGKFKGAKGKGKGKHGKANGPGPHRMDDRDAPRETP